MQNRLRGCCGSRGKTRGRTSSPPRCQIVLDRFEDLDFSSAAAQEATRKRTFVFHRGRLLHFAVAVTRVDIYRLSPRARQAVCCPSGGAWAKARTRQNLTAKARTERRQSRGDACPRLLHSKAFSGLHPPTTSPTHTRVLFLTRP